MTTPAVRDRGRTLERALFGLAALCLGAFVAAEVESVVYRSVQERRLEAELAEGLEEASPSAAVALTTSVTPPAGRVDARPEPLPPGRGARADRDGSTGGVIGRLEVPHLGLRVVVAEGIDAQTLRRAAGHVPGTALPGERGNVAIAGHRDREFRPLQHVRTGDRLSLVTPSGRYEYVVDWTAVVSPDRGDLLDPTDNPTLTLVTCHPFYMVGPAPERFVVRASLTSGS